MRTFLAKIRRFLIIRLSSFAPMLCDRLMFLHRFHRLPNLKDPHTLNEKILWLKQKVYADDPLVVKCADKYAVREYILEMGCGDVLNELYDVWDRPEDIDWEALPERFVLKCNHGCGYNYICNDKSAADRDACIALLQKWMHEDYWRLYVERHYRNIEKKIVCEKLLGDGKTFPTDYKVYCFNGKPLYILTCEDRGNGQTHFFFFDSNWNFCPITHDGLTKSKDFMLPKPNHFEKMLDYAEKLSAPFPFVRVDFYDLDEKLVFGELTFTPSAGLDTNRLAETDRMFGDMLIL